MTKPSGTSGWVSPACTLPTVEQPLRVAEFDDFFRIAVQRSTRTRATRLDLMVSPESESTARNLAERETTCCSFFRFNFEHAADGLLMRIAVPTDHVDVLDALQERILSVVGIKTVHGDV